MPQKAKKQSRLCKKLLQKLKFAKNRKNGPKFIKPKLKSGKKWAGFTIPVVYNPHTKELFRFEKYPLWGRIFYPHFKQLIEHLQ